MNLMSLHKAENHRSLSQSMMISLNQWCKTGVQRHTNLTEPCSVQDPWIPCRFRASHAQQQFLGNDTTTVRVPVSTFIRHLLSQQYQNVNMIKMANTKMCILVLAKNQQFWAIFCSKLWKFPIPISPRSGYSSVTCEPGVPSMRRWVPLFDYVPKRNRQ